jgi:hypothetical protein
MYLKTSGSNLTYYMGRSNFTISNGQGWILSQSNITFPPDTYHHLKWEIKFSDASDGYMRAYTDTGSGYVKWAEFNGVTYPSNWGNVYTIYANIRPPLGGPTNTLHWINHRLTLI